MNVTSSQTYEIEPGERPGTLVLNMGPQHPSTHGVLRVVLELDGEYVVSAKPDVGYLHTGFEKTYEDKPYRQIVPITDRMDYLNPMGNEFAYVGAVEKLLDLEVPLRAQYLRVLMAELTRINSHLVWLGTHALDLGAMSVFLYCFREREDLLDFFEDCTGQRMMCNYLCVGGVMADPPAGWTEALRGWLLEFPKRVDDYEKLLTRNRIWMQRTKGVGVLSAQEALALSVTGPVLRGSGVARDLRKQEPYSHYEDFDFEVPVGQNGDTYDRYMCRVEEMRQSRNLCLQVLDRLPEGPFMTDRPDIALPPKERVYDSMEHLIRHFKIVTEGFSVPAGEAYFAVESPRGELGFYLVSDGSAKPWRVRVRPPSFINLQALSTMVQGRLVADVVAIIGSIDIVLGEVDR